LLTLAHFCCWRWAWIKTVRNCITILCPKWQMNKNIMASIRKRCFWVNKKARNKIVFGH
jgi:hypothetical protein